MFHSSSCKRRGLLKLYNSGFGRAFAFEVATTPPLRRHDRLSPLISRQNDIKHFSFANVFAENNEVTSLQLVHNQGIKRHHNVPSTN